MSSNISISDITKINKINEYPKIKPEYVELHYMKRTCTKPSPQRNINHPDDGYIDIFRSPNLIINLTDTNSPFIWDGSYLGRIGNHNILEQVVYTGIKYWRLRILGHTKICIIRNITNLSPCIADEIKELFFLPKLGTHYVIYHSKKYLLIEARVDAKGKIIEEITIDKVDPNKNEKFVERVREIFVFREILGLAMTREKSITVRWSDKSYIPPYPVSFYENEMKPQDEFVCISSVVEKKWFGGIDVDDVVKQMLKIENNDDVSEKISYLRESITKIIERIDKDMVWIVSPIINKLTRRLIIDDSGIIATPDWD